MKSYALFEYDVSDFGYAIEKEISEPDKQFDSEGIYHVSLVLSKEEAQPEIKAINEVIAKKIAELHKSKPGTKEIKRAPLPYKDEDGKVVIKFKTKYKPKAFDKDNREMSATTFIYKGTQMRIKYKLNAYDQAIGIGCSLYLLAVQVAKLVEGQSEVEGFQPLTNADVSRLPEPEKVKAVVL